MHIKKITIPFLFLSFILTHALKGQETIVTNRPLNFNGVTVVGNKILQFENGVNYKGSSFNYLENMIRYGLPFKADIFLQQQVDFTFTNYNPYIGFKKKLFSEDNFIVGFSALAAINIDGNYYYQLLLRRNLNERFKINLYSEFNNFRFNSHKESISLSYSYAKIFSFTTEFFTQNFDIKTAQLNIANTALLSKDVQFDVNGGKNLYYNTYYINFGLSFRFNAN